MSEANRTTEGQSSQDDADSGEDQDSRDASSQESDSSNKSSNSDGDSQNQTAQNQTHQDPPPTIVEWSARLVSLGAVLVLLGYVVISGFAATSPPTIETRVLLDEIEIRNGSWVVPVDVTNEGDVSVSDAEITLEVASADGTVVESESVVIALLGQGGTSSVEFWLSQEPEPDQISVEVGSYILP